MEEGSLPAYGADSTYQAHCNSPTATTHQPGAQMDDSIQQSVRKGRPRPHLTRHIHGNPPSRGTDEDGPQRVAKPWQRNTTATGMETPTADHDFQPQRHRSIGNLPDQENTGHQKPHSELLLRRITDEAEKR